MKVKENGVSTYMVQSNNYDCDLYHSKQQNLHEKETQTPQRWLPDNSGYPTKCSLPIIDIYKERKQISPVINCYKLSCILIIVIIIIFMYNYWKLVHFVHVHCMCNVKFCELCDQ